MDMPADQYALYAEYGITAEKALVLEVAAGNLALSFLAMFVKTDEISPEVAATYRAIVDDVNKKTFGTLLKHLKSIVNFDDAIIKVSDEALERRNYLTHHFFRTHNFALFSEDGRKVMVAELKDIQAKLDQAQQFLEAIVASTDALAAKLAGRSPIDAADTALRLQTRGKRVNL
jgi:hypothetical protein